MTHWLCDDLCAHLSVSPIVEGGSELALRDKGKMVPKAIVELTVAIPIHVFFNDNSLRHFVLSFVLWVAKVRGIVSS